MRIGFSSPFRRHARSRRTAAATAGLAVCALALAACTSSPGSSTAAGSGAAPTSTPPQVSVHVTPKDGVNPTTPIKVTAEKGTLSSVQMENADSGAVVSGKLSDGGATWTSTEELGYSNTYTIDTVAEDHHGRTRHGTKTVTTLKPKNEVYPNLVPGPGAVKSVGIGQPIGFRFTQPVPDDKKAEVQKRLSVTSEPDQPGAFYWINDKNVHYRPKDFWKPGTKITVKAEIYGFDFSDGNYGAEDRTEHYTVHDSWIAKADGDTQHMKVYHNGDLVKTMPISMGKEKTPTHRGTHVISNRSRKVEMNSCSFGVCPPDPKAYDVMEYWAERISNDGEFVHQNPDSVASQGNTNVSHGCINLNLANAKWFYHHLGIGDVVEVVHSGGPKLKVYDLWGDWSLSWDEYQQGSALN
jgi:lipoprotein-anchoring transpeptidase ErfK/SrfK